MIGSAKPTREAGIKATAQTVTPIGSASGPVQQQGSTGAMLQQGDAAKSSDKLAQHSRAVPGRHSSQSSLPTADAKTKSDGANPNANDDKAGGSKR